MTPNPDGLLQEIENLKQELEGLGKDFSNYRHVLAVMEQGYEKAIAKVYIELLNPTSRADMGLEKLPAEDMRKAIAHSRMDENTWSAFLMAAADVESTDKLIKVKLAQLTGCQAQLNQLRAEFTHA